VRASSEMKPPRSLSLAAPRGRRPPTDRRSRIRGGKLSLIAWLALAGCGSPSPDMAVLMRQQQDLANAGMGAMLEKQRLMQDVMKNPDTAEWHDQRQKIVMAQGDRVIDKGFNRVFDSMTVALATLECKVQNMERASGYITASLPAMPPDQRDSLRQEALRSYAASKGYSPSLLDKRAKSPDGSQRRQYASADFDDMFDVESTIGLMGQHMGGVTLSLVRQGERQTKVKLRFDNVYYPRHVQEYYRIVWAAVDRQIFLDQALD
jgi:hypothetical protein